MRLPYPYVFFLLCLLLFPLLQQVSCNRCWGDISLRASVPAAVKPGQRVDFHAEINGGCECGGSCSVGVSCVNGDRTYTDSSSEDKHGYCTVNDVPGGEFRITATGSCQGPACGPGDIPGSTGPLSKSSGAAYIVSVPSFSVSADPRILPKRGSLTVRATGLGPIDDGRGTLSAIASFGGRSYTLQRSSQGSFEVTIDYDLRNNPAGQMEVEVTVTKSYAGVTDSKSRSLTVTLQGSRPRINADVPSELRRGDIFRVFVSEEDGDDVSGSISLDDSSFPLGRGENLVEVPADLKAGSHRVHASARDVDGEDELSASFHLINQEPELSLSVDKREVSVGERITISVSARDDAPGLRVRTQVGESVFDGTGIFEYTPRVPGILEVRALAVDSDGASKEVVMSVEVKGGGSGGDSTGGSGGGPRPSDGSGIPSGNSGVGSGETETPTIADRSSDGVTSAGITETETFTGVMMGENDGKSVKPQNPKELNASIEVEPEDPALGDEVTANVITEARGLLEVIDPDGKVIVSTVAHKTHFNVDKLGSWTIKFTYREGDKLRVVTRKLAVREREKPPEEPRSLPAEFAEESRSIEIFKPSCITIGDNKNENWFILTYLALTLPLLLLIAKRRVAG
ncbi:MAG: hypothetical protein BA066_02320 [Candidatus Korarchaeota archaeon NZ13-K]|nr:MAG: hypothetical protein BA066_02320 [Candidatus Korarchaeota archaeon NZ13-K]